MVVRLSRGRQRHVHGTVQAYASETPPEQADELRSLVRECEQALRTGPGGDMRKYLKKHRKPIILRLMLGQHCPVQVGAPALLLSQASFGCNTAGSSKLSFSADRHHKCACHRHLGCRNPMCQCWLALVLRSKRVRLRNALGTLRSTEAVV
jgi:hypothetical protein